MLFHSSNLSHTSLKNQTAIITGAGRGIGYEAARALLWLGANLVIAEIDSQSGADVAAHLGDEYATDRVTFIETDVGDQGSIQALKLAALERFGQVDIVINNATITPMGAIHDVPIEAWDASYRVNLRGLVLMAQAFLPAMIKRDSGVFVCVSSVGQAYMGAYETFKAAQVHLAETLDAELEGTGVHAFTIGPGLVRTPGALAGIEALAPLYDKTIEEFFKMSEDQIISPEAAGAAYAAAVVYAEKFRGQEIGSRQALYEAGIRLGGESSASSRISISAQDRQQALELIHNIHTTLTEQADGWRDRPLFERQWMFRDFKKNAGMPVEQWTEALTQLEAELADGQKVNQGEAGLPLDKLAEYYAHMKDLAASYEKDPGKLAENLAIIESWRDEVLKLMALMNG